LIGERRQFSPQFEAEWVLELPNGTHASAEVCRTHGIKSSLLLAWRKRLVEQTAKLFERESDWDPAQLLPDVGRGIHIAAADQLGGAENEQ
jgi:transposase-like protein